MRDLHREAWGSRGSGVQVIFVSEIARSATVLHQPLIEPDDVRWRANAFVRMDDDVSQFGTHTPRNCLPAPLRQSECLLRAAYKANSIRNVSGGA